MLGLDIKRLTVRAFTNVADGLEILKNAFQNVEENIVIFAGIDREHSTNETIHFGIYISIDNNAMWLPASTSEPEVIHSLNSMKIGQSFIITSEEDKPPLGTIINGIEVDSRCKFYPSITSGAKPYIILP